MLRRHRYKFIGGFAAMILGISFARGEDSGPRSLVHFIAVHDHFSLSVPWNMAKPVVTVPIKEFNRTTKLIVFRGHVKDAGAAGKDVVGGDLTIQEKGRTKSEFPNFWKERLAEVGTVQMPTDGQVEVYFVSMEGSNFQVWHFNLFNPKTSALITLSYSWAHDDPAAVRTPSKNFNDPDLADERNMLENLSHDSDYGIPFNKQ
jgi:hypothetical protein